MSEEYLIVYSTGGPDTFSIATSRSDFEALLAHCKKVHWPVRRTARLIPTDPPREREPGDAPVWYSAEEAGAWAAGFNAAARGVGVSDG